MNASYMISREFCNSYNFLRDFLYLNASPTTTTKQLINLDRDQEKAWNEPV